MRALVDVESEYRLDLARIADLWLQGSVVRSWLLELAAGALKEDPRLDRLKGFVQDSGEGRWMIADAIDEVPVPTLTTALYALPFAAGGIVREDAGCPAQCVRRARRQAVGAAHAAEGERIEITPAQEALASSSPASSFSAAQGIWPAAVWILPTI